MIFVITILSFYTFRIFTFCKILFINLSLASNPLIADKLKSIEHQQTFILAEQEYQIHTKYIIITIISIINIITILILNINNVNIAQSYLMISAIITTIILYLTIYTNIYPNWLINWTSLLQYTKDDVNLNIIRNRLIHIKQELNEVINGKIIPPHELTNLKHESILLSKTAEQLANNITNYR